MHVLSNRNLVKANPNILTKRLRLSTGRLVKNGVDKHGDATLLGESVPLCNRNFIRANSHVKSKMVRFSAGRLSNDRIDVHWHTLREGLEI